VRGAMPRIPPELCARCKGYKRLCGLPRCPLLDSFRAQVSAASRIAGTRAEGPTPPSALVGEHGYPRVSLYYMIPPGAPEEKARYYDAPREWAASKETLAGIIRLRSELVSARVRVDARNPMRLYEAEISPALASTAPVDSEALLAKPPTPRLAFDGVSKPRGPTAPAREIRVTSNPRLHPRLEKLVFDDARAAEAVWELYRAGVDVYTIQKAFSLGMLGGLRRRRLVPTRWAITAVDEILAGRIRAGLRGLDTIGEVEVYFGEYLGNRFAIVLLPGPGTFEWIEAWHPHTAWTRAARKPIIVRVEEDPLGRATAEDGGFSAAKVPVLEHLARRGNVVILREITPDYYAPVGNWHIRETVSAALARGPVAKASSPQEAARIVERMFPRVPELVRASRLLKGVKRVTDFF